jgi:hypothetical protein
MTDNAVTRTPMGNVFCDNLIRRSFIMGEVQSTIKPLTGIEEFGAGVVSWAATTRALRKPRAHSHPQLNRRW